MAVTDEQALEAIKILADRGDVEGARALAAKHKASRGGDQSTPGGVPLAAETGPSAEGGAPSHIGDVELTPAMRAMWDEGSAMEPGSEERGMLEAKFSGTLKSMQRGDSAVDMGVNAFASFFDTPVNIGTAIGGALNPNMTAKQALAMQGAYREAQGQKFPKSQFVSSIGGDIATGGLIVKGGAKQLRKHGAGKVVDKVSAFVKSKGATGALSRILLNSSVGAAEGALVEGLRRGEPLDGAALGLLNGPAGEALALLPKVAAALTPAALKDVMRDTQGVGLKILAEKLDLPHKEMAERWSRFSTIFGRPPSIAELTDDVANAELRDIVIDSTASATAARRGIDALEATKAREVGEALTRGGRGTITGAEERLRTEALDESFGQFRQDTFALDKSDLDFMGSRDFRDSISSASRFEMDELLKAGDGDSAQISGDLVEMMRQEIGDKAQSGAGGRQRALRAKAELESRFRPQSEDLSRGLDEGADRTRFIEGGSQGRSILSKTAGTSADKGADAFADAVNELDEVGAAGAARGVRSALKGEALGGAEKANRLTARIGKDEGLREGLEATLPAGEVADIVEASAVATKGAKNLRNLGPGQTPSKAGGLDKGRDITLSVMPGIPTPSRMLAMSRLMNKVHGVDSRVAENIARDLFDPEKSQEVIEMMLARGFKEADIQAIFIAGQAAGDTVQALNE